MPDDGVQLFSPPTVGRISTFGQTQRPFIAFCIATGGPSVNDYISRIHWKEDFTGIPFYQFADLIVATSAGGVIAIATSMPSAKTGEIPSAFALKKHFAEVTPVLMRPSLKSCVQEWRFMSSTNSRQFFQAAWEDQPLSHAKTRIGVYTASKKKKTGKTHLLRSYDPFKDNVRSFSDVLAFQAATATMAIPYAFQPQKIKGYNMYDAAGLKALPYRKTITQAQKLAEPGQPIIVIVMTPGDDGNPVSWYTRNIFEHPPRLQIEREIAKVSREFPDVEHVIIDPDISDIMGRNFPRLLDVSPNAIQFYHDLGTKTMERHKGEFELLKAKRGLSCAYV